MKKPIIAIVPKTGNPDPNGNKSCYALPIFVQAISASGGIPIQLNNQVDTYTEEDMDEILERVDGVLFTGGGDLDPKRYGEEVMDCCGEIMYIRDNFEFPLIEKVLKMDKPMLGICRGFQVLNVALGGTLYQDINTQLERPNGVEHRRNKVEEYPQHVHQVDVVSGTPLAEFANGKTRIGVNSLHHQAVKDMAPSLRSMAVSEDGIIEAVYLPGKKFAMGVQWHPEYLRKTDPIAQNIFDAFIKACSEK